MLHPDRFDAWGREYDTFRAVPLSEDGPRTGVEPYRWFTRADTLWVVWSDVRGRGGIALREEGRSLAGRAALAPPGAARRLDAQVNAWPVNCYTRLRERDPWLR
ncbi:MAG: hypothetical protein R3266_01070 [Gemmatimonadota bacterium]|nr:hypothetical protein [Gemmatimonadota bacterium]